jgi:hypothetical protein
LRRPIQDRVQGWKRQLGVLGRLHAQDSLRPRTDLGPDGSILKPAGLRLTKPLLRTGVIWHVPVSRSFLCSSVALDEWASDPRPCLNLEPIRIVEPPPMLKCSEDLVERARAQRAGPTRS